MNTTAVQKERKREGGREEEKSYQIDQEEYTGQLILDKQQIACGVRMSHVPSPEPLPLPLLHYSLSRDTWTLLLSLRLAKQFPLQGFVHAYRALFSPWL